MTLLNGGPAFPATTHNDSDRTIRDAFGADLPPDSSAVYPGMSLRDFMAAHAMQGDFASMVDPTGERCGLQVDLPDENLRLLATLYYRMADAMIKAREAQ